MNPNNKSIWRFLSIILLLSGMINNQLFAQNEPVLQNEEAQAITIDPTQLIFMGQVNEKGVELRWLPNNATQWEAGNQLGYTISRTEIGVGGQIDSTTKTSLNNGQIILPKDSLWFVQNAAVQDSFIKVIGTIFYDPDFQYEENAGMNALETRYNYLVYEADLNIFVAQSLGLSFLDSTAIAGRTYQYTVQSPSNGQIVGTGTIELKMELDAYVKTPIFYDNKYIFPDNVSLSKMRFGTERDRLIIRAKAYGDSIVLRWAPNNPTFWRAANKAGYQLERELVFPYFPGIDTLIDIEKLREPVILAGAPNYLMPWDSTKFVDNVTMADSMAVLAAQVMYGKQFQVQGQFGFINQAAELENRFSFGLFAAERSALAADAMGLRFVDREVTPGLTYRYFLTSPAGTSIFSIAMINVENVAEPDPAPRDFYFESGDHYITLFWNKLANDPLFSAYQIERSDDGGNSFTKLNNAPLVFTSKEGAEETSDYSYTDSIGTNYKKYIYRLSGLTAFAEISPAAEVTAFATDQTAPSQPFISTHKVNEAGLIELGWDFPAAENADIAGFDLAIGGGEDSVFTTITRTLLSPNSRTYILQDTPRTDISYYFKITARDTAGNESTSYPSFVHVIDNNPPAAPTNLNGFIDSVGRVTVLWNHGAETDLEGYRVYFSNNPEMEFSQVTISTTPLNTFNDSIAIVTLSESIYYKLQAEDVNNNRSEFSEILELKRPDVVPPVAPVLHHPEISDSLIILNWIPSSSLDVVAHEVYRRLYSDTLTDWNLIATIEITDTSFTDRTAIVEQLYEYSLRAKDDADLYSDYAFPVKGRKWFNGNVLNVNDLSIDFATNTQSIQLQWQFLAPDFVPLKGLDYRFYLYKSTGEAPVTRYRQLKSQTLSFSDNKVEATVKHNYAIKVVFENGKSSLISEVISILPDK